MFLCFFRCCRVQELLQAQRAAEPDVLLQGQSELSHRPAPPQPVPVLSAQEVSQDGHAERRSVRHLLQVALFYSDTRVHYYIIKDKNEDIPTSFKFSYIKLEAVSHKL